MLYKNKDHKLSFEIVNDWVIKEDQKNSIVMLIPNSSDFISNINVMSIELTKFENNLETFLKKSLNDLKNYLGNFNLIESDSITISGYPAYKIIYSGEINKKNLKWLQAFFIKNDKAFVLSYCSDETGFLKLINTIEKIISTFSI